MCDEEINAHTGHKGATALAVCGCSVVSQDCAFRRRFTPSSPAKEGGKSCLAVSNGVWSLDPYYPGVFWENDSSLYAPRMDCLLYTPIHRVITTSFSGKWVCEQTRTVRCCCGAHRLRRIVRHQHGTHSTIRYCCWRNAMGGAFVPSSIHCPTVGVMIIYLRNGCFHG